MLAIGYARGLVVVSCSCNGGGRGLARSRAICSVMNLDFW